MPKSFPSTVDPWGRVIYQGSDAVELLMRGLDITHLNLTMTPEIEAYNQACLDHDKLSHIVQAPTPLTVTPEQDAARRQSTWFLPEQYGDLDVRAKLLAMCDRVDEIERVNLEMDMFEERGLLPVLRLMCFLVDQWRANGIVWGVGRGSSVASYCLFLLGVHKINSLAYNLAIEEFLK